MKINKTKSRFECINAYIDSEFRFFIGIPEITFDDILVSKNVKIFKTQ